VAGVDTLHRQITGDGVSGVDRLLEGELHFRRQPSQLPTDFADHRAGQQSVGDGARESLELGEGLVVVDGVVVPGELTEGLHLLETEGTGEGEAITRRDAFGGPLPPP
jgi:hypothetical protein